MKNVFLLSGLNTIFVEKFLVLAGDSFLLKRVNSIEALHKPLTLPTYLVQIKCVQSHLNLLFCHESDECSIYNP